MPPIYLQNWITWRGLSTLGKHELPKLLERYLTGLGQLVEQVDAMKLETGF
ncbi:MAG: hypothetical protein OXI53_03120 [Nitrospira sp.]|nr:hypothetical protein [Nitrospira sp.]MDE0404282.1 hypothetical protein [Nitrospira sp.]